VMVCKTISSVKDIVLPKGAKIGFGSTFFDEQLCTFSDDSKSNHNSKNNHDSNYNHSKFNHNSKIDHNSKNNQDSKSDHVLKSNIGEQLTEEQKERLIHLLRKSSDIFSKSSFDLGKTNVLKHSIDTGNNEPIRQTPYRKSYKEREELRKEVDKLLQHNLIRESTSPWGAPVVLVRKRDGSWRFCVDWRKLNKATRKDVHPLPRIDDNLDRLADATTFSTIDLTSGYFQVELEEKDKEKTAFVTPDGHFEFNVLGMGFCNAPATFQKLMYKVLGNLMWQICTA
ncbi:Retrovirus-related Pol polyprotein from transposon 17.6-like protein, partial [Leptotrombidium deliense]